MKKYDSDIIVEPYCVNVMSHSAEVFWIDDVHEDGKLEVRSDDREFSFGSLSAPLQDGGFVLHKAVLSQLPSNAIIRYALTRGGKIIEGSFRTAPEDKAVTTITFAVLGDSQPASAPRAASAVAMAVAGEKPSFVIHLGDLTQEIPPTVERLRDQFFRCSSPYLSTCAFYPIYGNHEGDGTLFRLMFGVAPLPYRLVRWGNCGFVLIDVGVLEKQKNNIDTVLEQLDKDLGSMRLEWLLVVCHVAPGFGVGAVRNPWKDLAFKQALLPVLEKNGVDVVFSGHSHIYERFLPIGPSDGKPVIHIISGGGGGNLMSVRPSPILANGIGKNLHHYLLLEVEGQRLKMIAKTPDGVVIDSFELEKRNGKYQDEVMKSAVETSLADKLALLYDAIPDDRLGPPHRETPHYRYRIDFKGIPDMDPDNGTVIGVILNIERFPKGSELQISLSDGCTWSMVSQKFVIDGETIHLKATAPAGLTAATGLPLILDLKLTVEGRSFGPSPIVIKLNNDH